MSGELHAKEPKKLNSLGQIGTQVPDLSAGTLRSLPENSALAKDTLLDSDRVVFISTKSEARQFRSLIEGLRRLPEDRLAVYSKDIVPFWTMNVDYAVSPERLHNLYHDEKGVRITGPAFAISTGQIRFYPPEGATTISAEPFQRELSEQGVVIFPANSKQLEQWSRTIDHALAEQLLARLSREPARELDSQRLREVHRYRLTQDQNRQLEHLKVRRIKAIDAEPDLITAQELGNFTEDLFDFLHGDRVSSRSQEDCVALQLRDGVRSERGVLFSLFGLLGKPPLVDRCRAGRQEWRELGGNDGNYPLHSDTFLSQGWSAYNKALGRAVMQSKIPVQEYLDVGEQLGLPVVSSAFYGEGTKESLLYDRLNREARRVYLEMRKQGYRHSDLCSLHVVPVESARR